MKKTLTRVLSLVMILAMFVSAMPLAMAEEIMITDITLTGPSGSLTVGQTAQIGCTVTPDNTTEAVEWSCSPTSVATVNMYGVVTAQGPGKATVTASSSSGLVQKTVSIEVANTTQYNVSISSTSMTLNIGEEKSVPTISVTNLTADKYNVAWSVSPSSVASYASGMVKGLGKGDAKLVATVTSDYFATVTKECTVKVSDEEYGKYTPVLTPASMTMNVDETKNMPTLTVTGLTEGVHYTVNWNCNGDLVISNDGKTVTAHGATDGKIGAQIVPITPLTKENFTQTIIYCPVDITAEVELQVPYTVIGLAEGEGSITLEKPTLKGNNVSDLTVISYNYALDKNGSYYNAELDDDTLSPRSAGVDMLTLTATVKNKSGNSVSVPSVKIPVTVYKNAQDIVAYVKESVSSFTFAQTNVFNKLTLGGYDYTDDRNYNTLDTLLNYVNWEEDNDRGSAAGYTLYVGRVNGAGGNLSLTTTSNLELKGASMTDLEKIKFTKDTGARSEFQYEIKDDKGYTMTLGTFYIYYDQADIIEYETDFDTAVTFDEDDFVEFWNDHGTGTLSYVKFTEMPSTNEGKLYTNKNLSTQVSTSDKYKAYYSSGPTYKDLDTVTFKPNTSRSSKYTVDIPFTAYNNNSGSLKGSVIITVTDGSADGDIVYTTEFKKSVTFDENDFEEFWDDYGTGTLSYVKFTELPTSYYGTLYTTSSETTTVKITDKFQANYANSANYNDLDRVTFKPNTSRTSKYTVTIPFAAYSTSNKEVKGTVAITVADDDTSDTITALGIYLGHSGYKFHDAIAEEFKAEKGRDLEYVTFIQPSVEYGKLYYDYESLSDSKKVTSQTKFYYEPSGSSYEDLADVWFIPAAGFKGTVKLHYTAYANNNTKYDGVLSVKVASKTAGSNFYFNDVNASAYSWACDSVEFLRYNNIVNGTNDANTQFSPKNNITRAHFMLMLYRAFLAEDYSNYSVNSNFADITKGSSDYAKELYQAVGVAKSLGIATGDGTNYYPNKNISREEAMTLIYRTLDKLNLNLEYTGTMNTGDFSDYSKVSSYAKEPLKYLIDHGVVVGDSGKINPKSNITRAEMAVILHRVLTY